MKEETRDMRLHIEALQVRVETLETLITAVLSAFPEKQQLVDHLRKVEQLQDASSPYATSLSDGQRDRVLSSVACYIAQLSGEPRT